MNLIPSLVKSLLCGVMAGARFLTQTIYLLFLCSIMIPGPFPSHNPDGGWRDGLVPHSAVVEDADAAWLRTVQPA